MRILITAGPTREYIDAVRFLTNASSGKMGYSMAEECVRRGHSVRLISGPVQIPPPENVNILHVVSADDMLKEVERNLAWCDSLIMCAAVSDFRPVKSFTGKIKKSEMPLEINLQPNEDILKSIAGRKGNRIFIGFAAESGDPVESARRKLADKMLDMIVANDVSRPDAGFGVDTNKITIIDNSGLVVEYPVMSKHSTAVKIIDWMDSRFASATPRA